MNTMIATSAEAAAPTAMDELTTHAAPVASTCSHSISKRLSNKLAVLIMGILAALLGCSWLSTASSIIERRSADLHERCTVISDIIELEARNGGEAAVMARVKADAGMRAYASLVLEYADGRPFYSDPIGGQRAMSQHTHSESFTIPAPGLPGGELKARYTADYARDVAMGRRWALIFALTTLAAGALTWLATRWRVRQMLRPLKELAAQTRAMSPDQLDQRLHLNDPPEEVLPWITQFNALMARTDRAYAQLEAFNADVAHELRTPLATLMMQTELALSRGRSSEELRETMTCSMEELQRMSALINDMLFLSQADRGAKARRGEPVSLAALAQEVIEFHEAALEDAGLRIAVEGDATLPIDAPLVQRALSNLVSNATRFAKHGSVVRIALRTQLDGCARVTVHNEGPGIRAEDTPRLFNRFFRGDTSRCCEGDGQHFGLGLAIVAAIARMHEGEPHASSTSTVTSVGFTMKNTANGTTVEAPAAAQR
jgi:two-component system, OmpR family, heavy metal sensor histidine kinase CusS